MVSVSVIIPVYNREKTIRYCLDSILAQSFQAIEIVVVDDASTDGTVDIVQQIEDNRVRCVRQPQNSGAQAARNRGIREAKGEWIAFQDSDDEWLPEKLEKQVAALADVNFQPMTVIHTDCFRYDHLADQKTLWSLSLVNGLTLFPLLLTTTGPMFQGILTSKAALEKIGFLDEEVPSYQEWDTSIRLARECRFIHIREPLFIYHFHSGETISKDNKRDIDGFQYIIDKFRDEILLHCGPDTLNRHLISNAIRAKRFGLDTSALVILEKCTGWTLKVALLKLAMKNNINFSYYSRCISLLRRFSC